MRQSKRQSPATFSDDVGQRGPVASRVHSRHDRHGIWSGAGACDAG
jgi:hypothetical protein